MKKQKRYYLDTSIWLDFFEKRNEPNLPKGTWAIKLIEKILKENSKILYSDLTMIELGSTGYSIYELEDMLLPFKAQLIFVEASKIEIGKGRDLSQKREIPKGDTIHALIARNNHAILVTLDEHFQKLADITKPHKPQELI